MKNFEQFGIKIPKILLPKNKDLKTWCVVACDQYTQDENYWNRVAKNVGDKESTLNLILPEVYLGRTDTSMRIQKIHKTMNDYLENNIFDEESEFIYLERKTSYGRTRKGLVVAIDLDSYEWKPFNKAKIRATEATIVSRIPPRKEIRKGAALESPHIMLLVDDFEKNLIEKTGNLVKKNPPIYDGDLMESSGHVTGWAVKSQEAFDCVFNALSVLKEKNSDSSGNVFMFAVGDGNHSLATAKAVWEEYKAEQIKSGALQSELENSPIRYALVELVNIYDEGLTFEPIHRVVFNADVQNLILFLAENLFGKIVDFSCESELEDFVKNSKANFGFVYSENGKTFYKGLQTQIKELAVSKFQPVLDKFIEQGNLELAKESENLLSTSGDFSEESGACVSESGGFAKTSGACAARTDACVSESGACVSKSGESSSDESSEKSVSSSASTGASFDSEESSAKTGNFSASTRASSCAKGKKVEIDYIHGSSEVFRLGKVCGNLAIMLPPVAKESFFETINSCGSLPRKSFSMGEASEKRFYLECRRLFS